MNLSHLNDDQTELKIADTASVFHVGDHFQLHAWNRDRPSRHVMRVQARFVKSQAWRAQIDDIERIVGFMLLRFQAGK